MAPRGRTAPQETRVMPDHLGQVDLLAEGDQELQGCREPTACQAEWDHRAQQALKVLQGLLALSALMDPQVFLALFLMAVGIFCVPPFVPMARLVLLGCQDSKDTQAIRETKENSAKTGRRVSLARLVLQVLLVLWVCRAHVVSGASRGQWEL
ncbi:unnamed protein product [Arctogadus glacialis]